MTERQRRLLAAPALLGLLTAASGGVGCGDPATAGELHELTSVEDLRERFDADAGKPRLVLLLSPT